jgi:hypothetical protein
VNEKEVRLHGRKGLPRGYFKSGTFNFAGFQPAHHREIVTVEINWPGLIAESLLIAAAVVVLVKMVRWIQARPKQK